MTVESKIENNLFNDKKMEEFIQLYDDELTVNADCDPINYWIKKLDNDELKNEKTNYIRFFKIILENILGYEFTDIQYEENIGDEGRPVEFTLKKGDKDYVVVELKGTTYKDLNKRYNREQSPIEQVTNYASIKEETQWAFVSNYDEFRFFNPSYREKYISFKFKQLTDTDVLKRFLLIFSKFSLIEKDIPQTLLKETRIIERELEDEFYKLFSETRLMLIKELEHSSEDIDRIEAIRLAQLILNRFIFLCFAEDLRLIPSETTADVLLTPIKHKNLFEFTMWDRINELFRFADKGNEERGIGAFNGGLFKENLRHIEIRDKVDDLSFFNDCYKTWKFEEKYEEIESLLDVYKSTLNPIYKNLLLISSFDFGSELSVNILGHIFENSIGDIEELKDETKKRRKKDGVFYTPEYITEYICRNTIIPYLSISGEASTVHELISEYEDSNSLDELDTKLKEVKIIDISCGSGAFLNKAVDILFEIHKAYHDSKYSNDLSLNRYFDSLDSRKQIISNNIYGVDVNEESVEITKLSLFLKLATSTGVQEGFKLPNLDRNIRCGNSVIDDESIAKSKAFKWKEEFKEVFDNGGFDLIIGNPPYVRVQEMPHEEIDYYTDNYKFSKGHVDLSTLFIEQSEKLIKNDGLIGIITSNMFLTTGYGKPIRKFLLNDIQILQIIDFGDLDVFNDAITYVSIFIFKKNKPNSFNYYHVPSLDIHLEDIPFEKIDITQLNSNQWNLKNHKLNTIFNKIKKFPMLKDGIGKCWTGLITGKDNLLVFDDINDSPIEKEIFLPILSAKDCGRYRYSTPTQWVTYPYKLEGDKTVLLSEEEIKETYPCFYKFLIENKEELMKRKDSRKTLEDSPSWFKLIRQGNLKIFKTTKIISPGESKQNKFGIDSGNSYKNARLISITPNEDTSIYYLLGILNSHLIEKYLHSISSLKKGGYHSYSPKIIDTVPIPKNILENQKPLIESVSSILELNKKLDRETKSFNNWIKRTFNITKLSKKLINYHEYDFDDFLMEIKNKKVDISKRKTQELLENEFNESLSIIKPLQKEIIEVETEINQIVYELYGLTAEEIAIIENSFKE